MGTLLAIHEDTNANATLFRDGVPVFAVAEERLTRRRFQPGFPTQAVAACLRFAGLDIDDVDAVLPGNRHHVLPRIDGRLLGDDEHDYFGLRHRLWLGVQAQVARPGLLARGTEALGLALLRRRLPRVLPMVDHHTAHAASAFRTSGFPSALCVTADNMGDGWSSKVFVGRGGRLDFQYGSTALHSPGQFYGEIAQLLGFHNLMAGKVTGLAAHGDPRPAYPLMEQLFALAPDGRGFVTPGLLGRSRRRPPWSTLRSMRPADVAAAAQKRLEDVLVAYVQRAMDETGERRVALAGGVFANVCVNRRIAERAEAVVVHPAMTDQGISLGAGLAFLGDAAPGTPPPDWYLGPDLDEEAAGAALEAAGLRYTRPTELEGEIAGALADGQVVARCTGRMEYGLRALGHRSILYRADDPSVQRWLNQKLRRSDFMPFAPVVRADDAADWFDVLPSAAPAARAMTVTFDATPRCRAQAPAVVHVDGTARPQLLDAATDPGLDAIVRRYGARTGVPVLINTSFNLHGEPIVCTAEDAVRAFVAADLDRLALGPFLTAPRDRR